MPSNVGPHNIFLDNLSDVAANLFSWLVLAQNDGSTAPPTAAAGSNAGTSPPAPVVGAGSTSRRGNLTFGTGGTAAAGNEVVVTFAAALPVAPRSIQLTPQNAVTAALVLYVTSISTAGFTIGAQTAPANSQGNTTYSVGYSVET